MKKKVVNIAVDIETLSKRSTAAIIGIAAKAFSLGEHKAKEGSVFKRAVDATSCAMFGMDFDNVTIEWWSKKPTAVKEQFSYGYSIGMALRELTDFVKDVKTLNGAEEVVVWCQGTDFDIPILRNAFVLVNNDREEKTIPWKYLNVRDSRTFIHEGVRLIDPSVDNPYSIIPENKNWVEHDAMSDCDQLIHNVTWVNDKISELLTANKSKENADETAEQV